MDNPYVIAVIVVIVACLIAFVAATLIDGKEEVVVTPPDPQATILDASRSQAWLYPNGREVFFPKTIHSKPVYEITFTGILRRSDGLSADALYQTDGCGNFTWHIDWLRVNGQKLCTSTSELVEAERFEHRYTFHVDGKAERLTLALNKNETWLGALMATVRVLPPETLSIADCHAARSARLEAKWEQDKVSVKFAQQIKDLCIRSEVFRNWADPDFRTKFAEVHGDELISNQSEIRAEATTLLAQDQIVGYLRRHNPEVVERFVGRLEALLIAERRALEKRLTALNPPPATPPPPRKKLTADQVREIKVRKQQVEIGDKVALKLDKVETRLRIRERLDSMSLDPDERELLEAELISEIEEGDNDHENAKTI